MKWLLVTVKPTFNQYFLVSVYKIIYHLFTGTISSPLILVWNINRQNLDDISHFSMKNFICKVSCASILMTHMIPGEKQTNWSALAVVLIVFFFIFLVWKQILFLSLWLWLSLKISTVYKVTLIKTKYFHYSYFKFLENMVVIFTKTNRH